MPNFEKEKEWTFANRLYELWRHKPTRDMVWVIIPIKTTAPPLPAPQQAVKKKKRKKLALV